MIEHYLKSSIKQYKGCIIIVEIVNKTTIKVNIQYARYKDQSKLY